MARLLVNENFPGPSLKLLREWGLDVIAISEVSAGAADADVLSLARTEERWLITYDRDYGELVYSKGLPAPPAIVYLRQEPYPPTHPASMIRDLLARASEVERHMVVVSRGSVRRRPLP